MDAGLGPDGHIREALKLQSPFATPPEPDDDVGFAADAMARFGQSIANWRRQQLEHMADLKRALGPLTSMLVKCMP